MPAVIHLNLDDAFAAEGVAQIDARRWGPPLRFYAPPRVIEQFYTENAKQLTHFIVYGSGDFHHLTALWIRSVTKPTVVVSFDNHPDWDVRPPKWCCGSWVNRALELPNVTKVSVWGCGNFECWWPGQIFGNRRAERLGTLEVHPWADERQSRDQQRRGAIFRDSWRDRFTEFAKRNAGIDVYVTIDIDCLRADEAATNWENGRFSVDDLVWALRALRSHADVVAGDICGAYSPPKYARRWQRFISEMDHPKLGHRSVDEVQRVNARTLAALLPALAG